MNREKWKYCARVRRQLLCSRRTRERIMKPLESRIDAWLEENPGARREQIEAYFGTPTQIAAAYIADRSSEELVREMMVRGRILRTVAAVLLVILVCYAGRTVRNVIHVWNMNHGYIVVTTERVIIPTTPEGYIIETTSPDGE